MFHGQRVLALLILGADAVPEWLSEQGLAGRVQIVNVSADNRGLKASTAHSQGDEILSVPLRHVFCLETVANFRLGRLLLHRSDLTASDILAAALAEHAHERFREAIPLRLLPENVSHHPLFYDDATWKVADKLVSGRFLRSALEEVQQSWQRISAVLQGLSVEAGLLERDYRWAHAILRSRGHTVRLRKQNGEWHSTWGLVPLADMINMDPQPNVDCRTSYASNSNSWGLNGTFHCTARGSIDVGQDLWTEYVSKAELRTSATFLREYGFVPAECPHDALSWLPPTCTSLRCMLRLDPEQLQEQFGPAAATFLEQALQNVSSVEAETQQPALKSLAQNERNLLLQLRVAWQRFQLPRAMFESWRGEPDLNPSSSEAQRLFQVLRSDDMLHTLAWDRAIWDAGQLLVSHWDYALAAEVLYSHHDFTTELEQIFRMHRKEAITKKVLQCAFAAQALLNDFAWPVDAEERAAINETTDTLVRAMFVPDRIRSSGCPRAEALLSEREWEEEEQIERCPFWAGAAEKSVEEMYTSHPYPSWRRFGHMSGGPRTKVRRSLIAGVGTGKAVLAHLQHFDPQEILAVDLSKPSLKVAKRQFLALGIRNVVLWQCDLTTLEGQFDVIESVGVLHHLPDPAVGFKAMKRLLAPKGTLVLGLYSRMARRSIPVIRHLARNANYEQFRTFLTGGEMASPGEEGHVEKARFQREFLTEFSISSRSTFEDLLLHPVEHVFELPQLEELLAEVGLKITGVRVPPGIKGVAERWQPFFMPQRREVPGWPHMPLLAFLHRIETEIHPLLFTNMYVFTVAHGSSSILRDMSPWLSQDDVDAESLPLPFEAEWSREILQSAVEVFCSRVMHHVNGTGKWTSPAVAAWLESKVALGPHAAQVARALRTGDAVAQYCAMLVSHFLE